jgi:hypothetical protein
MACTLEALDSLSGTQFALALAFPPSLLSVLILFIYFEKICVAQGGFELTTL